MMRPRRPMLRENHGARTMVDVEQNDCTKVDKRKTANPSINEDTSPGSNPWSISRASSSGFHDHTSSSKRLVSSQSPDLLARIKSIFQEDLITEDDGNFVGDGLHITAYVIRNGESHCVLHSGRLALKKSHAKNLLVQPESQNWFKTFTFLDDEEMSALYQVLTSPLGSRVGEWTRRLILLKRMRKARIKFWKQGINHCLQLSVINGLNLSYTVPRLCTSDLWTDKCPLHPRLLPMRTLHQQVT